MKASWRRSCLAIEDNETAAVIEKLLSSPESAAIRFDFQWIEAFGCHRSAAWWHPIPAVGGSVYWLTPSTFRYSVCGAGGHNVVS